MIKNPYVRIQTSDTTLNRIQSQISAAFSAIGPGSNPVTQVTQNKYQIKSSDVILAINTNSIGGATTLFLPDATKLNGFSFSFKKTDTSSNTVSFISTVSNQNVENASSYSTSASLASGEIFSDGSNWWVI